MAVTTMKMIMVDSVSKSRGNGGDDETTVGEGRKVRMAPSGNSSRLLTYRGDFLSPSIKWGKMECRFCRFHWKKEGW